MRLALRLALGALLIVLIPLFLLFRHLLDLSSQYNTAAYLKHSFKYGTSDKVPSIPAEPDDKTVIMAKTERENTDWVATYLPDWQRAIYTVNPSFPPSSSQILTTPLNKGHESMAYLTYVIDNYDSLPSMLAFLHSHASGFLSAWHTDTPLHSNIDALSTLQLPFVRQNGYVNLRCNQNPGCLLHQRFNKHVTPEVWHEIFGNASKSVSSYQGNKNWVPEQVGAACCAQFAVSRDRVLQRPKSDYETFRTWVTDTGKSDRQSGRVMEFLWHIIFGMDAVYCPDEKTCYCQVYGRC